MNLYGRFFKRKPRWLLQIPPNLRPSDAQCEELENVRKHYSIPPDIFAGVLLTSPHITRRVQENAYASAKEKMPSATEKELLEAVLRSRVYPQNPAGFRLTEEEIELEMQNIESLEDLIRRVIDLDKDVPRLVIDTRGIGEDLAERVDRILGH